MGKELLVFFVLILDLVIVILIIVIYFKLKKFLDLPLEEIKESIVRASELVGTLERLKGAQTEEEEDLKSKVLWMIKQGHTPKEIAKKLGLSQGEVELLLKSKGYRIE